MTDLDEIERIWKAVESPREIFYLPRHQYAGAQPAVWLSDWRRIRDQTAALYAKARELAQRLVEYQIAFASATERADLATTELAKAERCLPSQEVEQMVKRLTVFADRLKRHGFSPGIAGDEPVLREAIVLLSRLREPSGTPVPWSPWQRIAKSLVAYPTRIQGDIDDETIFRERKDGAVFQLILPPLPKEGT